MTRYRIALIFCSLVSNFVPVALPAAVTAPAAALPRSTPSHYRIFIDSHSPTLHVYRDGQEIKTYAIALGTAGAQTPIGTWHIVDKQRGWGGGFGSRWMGLDVPWGTYGIHGTNVPTSVGQYASHGCIRMRNADIEVLFEMVPRGTPVEIVGHVFAYRRSLKHGDVGADVLAIQKRLAKAGFYRGQLDGRFGWSTDWAVRWFELRHQLPMRGVVSGLEYTILTKTSNVALP